MGIASELSSIKTNISDKVVLNKVSRFAYKERAYTENDVNGVTVYDVNQDNNIPVGTASVMKVNSSVIELGWRARASSITRMLMNHFLGRISYNLNKANDMINSILSNLISYIGQPDGLATLDSNGLVPRQQLYSNNIFTVRPLAWEESEPLANLPKTLLYANNMWVIGCNVSSSQNNPQFYWSTDGSTFNPSTNPSPAPDYIQIINYFDGTWIAGDMRGKIFRSTDGKNWTASTINNSYGVNILVPKGNGVWYATCAGVIFKSTDDGVTWENLIPTPYQALSAGRIRDIIITDSFILCACESNSPSLVRATTFSSPMTWTSVLSNYGTGKTLHYFSKANIFLLGTSGKYTSNDTSTDTESLFYSTDSINWTPVQIVPKGVRVLDIEDNGEYLLACADSGIYKSYNGLSWVKTTELQVNKLYFKAGVWWGVSETSMWLSVSGNHWTNVIAYSYFFDVEYFPLLDSDGTEVISIYGEARRTRDGVSMTTVIKDHDLNSILESLI